MGIFRTPKYKPDPEAEERRRKQKEEEERIKKEAEEAEKRFKKRYSKGMIGSRSLFSKAGGSGFYTEGEEN
jgi:hypothetical protein|tara:strand:- start:1570 stop:1782 length:213 start_codon:yes stop_codon:yes gene_type:complete